jgi:hypothetical protein
MPTGYCKRDLRLVLTLTIGGSANNSLPVVIFMRSVYLELLNCIPPPPPQYWMLRTYDRFMGALSRAPRRFQRIRTYCWDPEGRYAWVSRRHQHYGHEVTEFRKTLYAYPAIEITSPVRTWHACTLVRWWQQYQQFNLRPICEIFCVLISLMNHCHLWILHCSIF